MSNITNLTKIVGLDFDNVINDEAHITATSLAHPGVRTFNLDIGRAMIDPVRAARVQRICDATGAGILLVTGWRRWTGWEELAGLLKDNGITAPVVGAVGGVRFSGDLRASATREWLDKNPHITRYAIIDDGTHYWRDYEGDRSPWKPFLVAPTDGIEDEHVAQASPSSTDCEHHGHQDPQGERGVCGRLGGRPPP